jgi:hypothetical protein
MFHGVFMDVFSFCFFGILLQITIWVSRISFYAYADIAFESSSDVSSEFV